MTLYQNLEKRKSLSCIAGYKKLQGNKAYFLTGVMFHWREFGWYILVIIHISLITGKAFLHAAETVKATVSL